VISKLSFLVHWTSDDEKSFMALTPALGRATDGQDEVGIGLKPRPRHTKKRIQRLGNFPT
jgi:hypothetical protein